MSYFRQWLIYKKHEHLFTNGVDAANFQNKELSALLNYAKEHTLYFGSLLKGSTINEENCISIIKDLPILTKDIIRENEDSIYSDKVIKGVTPRRTTGGSTGEPFGFYNLRQSLDLEYLLQSRLYYLMGWKYNETIVSFDGYNPGNDENQISRKDVNFPYGKYHFSSYLLTEKRIRQYVEELNAINPTVFRGYSSSISKLCYLIEKYSLKLNFSLKGIYVTSDTCTKEDEIIIKRVLNCPVWGQYGHTEVSIFAIKHPESEQYLCNPIYGYTEIINRESGKHVGIGETGEIIVTGFSSYGLPFIRYATGDMAVYGGLDKFHNVILSNLQGRSADYILNYWCPIKN